MQTNNMKELEEVLCSIHPRWKGRLLNREFKRIVNQALRICVIYDDLPKVKLLLNHGASIISLYEGGTLLDLAYDSGAVKVYKFLQKRNSKLGEVNIRGRISRPILGLSHYITYN